MKRFITSLFVCLFVLICYVANAGVDSVTVVSSIPAAASEGALMLFTFAILGILLHWLIDLKKAKKQCIDLTVASYLKDTWLSSVISLVLCTIAIMARKELTGIAKFAMWQGVIVAALGYMGDSILPMLFGFAKKAGIDIEGDKN